MQEIFAEFGGLLLSGTWDTLLMVFISTFFAYVFGLPIGVIVTITQSDSIMPCRPVNMVLGWIVNIGRSIPFIILIVALMPFTRALVGSGTGVRGAVVPLIIAAAPFVARLVETSLMEVDEGLIEVAHATGSTIPQIVFKVMLPEGKPSILMGVPITLITLLGYSAMAGAVGAGGLGDIALRYGYYRYQDEVMIITIVLIIVIVQLIQSLGTYIAKRADKRIRR
ncbi:MAG: methionine ABC transporter permease [Anaerovoracaceae bacterium]